MLPCCSKEDKERLIKDQEASEDVAADDKKGTVQKSMWGGTGSRRGANEKKSLKRYDVVLVLPRVEMTEEEKKKDAESVAKRQAEIDDIKKRQRELRSTLKATDLNLHTFNETAQSEKGERRQFVLVGADVDLLKESAEAIEMPKKIKPLTTVNSKYEAYAPYSRVNHDKFLPDHYGGFFTSLERIKCIFHLIESPVYADPGCAGLDLDKLVAEGVISNYFCLDDQQRLQDLKTMWIYGNLLRPAPVAMIRDYLGEKIALYFAWMQTYTNYLIVLGVFSIVPFVAQIVDHANGHARGYDNWAVPAYGVVAVIWGQAFLEHWKRSQSTLAFIWNIEDFEDDEVLRPEFRREVQDRRSVWLKKHGSRLLDMSELPLITRVLDPPVATYKKGRWSRAGFVEVDENDELAKDLDEVEYFDESWQQFRLIVSASIAAVLVFVIVVGTIALMALKVWLATKGEWWEDHGMLISAFLNSAFITVMSMVWATVGILLNDFEMHRTDTEWEDSLITKTFVFQFINSYVASLYIAFVQGSQVKLPFFGRRNGEPLRDHCIDHDCFKALYFQMGMLIVSKQVTRHVLVLAPIVFRWVQNKLYPQAEEKSKLHAMVVEQSRRFKFGGTHNEYLEMVIQFGYVCMFAVAFPIGALIVAVNNLLEKRSDAMKVTLYSQRPKYLGAQDIGSVQSMLEIVALCAVVTNIGILYLSSQAYWDYFPKSWQEKPRFSLLAATVALEHVILGVKQVVNWAVPDSPAWVEIERTRNKMRQEALVQLNEHQLALKDKRDKQFAKFRGDESSSSDDDESGDEAV